MAVTPPNDHAVWRPIEPRPRWVTRPAWWWRRLRHGRPWRPVFLVLLTVLATRGITAGPAGDGSDIVRVYVAARDIDAGRVLDETDVVRAPVDRAVVPTNAVSTSPVGRVATSDVPAGRVLSPVDLGEAGALRQGERAVAIAPLEPVAGLAPGDRIDLIGVRFDVFGDLERRRLVSDARVLDPGDDRHPPLVAVPEGDDLEVLDWVASGTVAFSRRP